MPALPHLSRDTLLAQGGGPDPATGALAVPIHPAVTFARDPDGALRSPIGYGREGQDNLRRVEALLAALEGGADALLFPSGSAAATNLLLTLRPGDHLLLQRGMYYEFLDWIGRYAAAHGIALDQVDPSDPAALAAALRPGRTRLVWIETPSNPHWRSIDIAAVAALSRPAGATLLVDSTAATPVLTRPIEHGADLVLHSATKALNGHDDVMAGALVCARADPAWDALRALRYASGAVPAAAEAWLLLRGMRTLALRVGRASHSAARLAAALDGHPALERVLYPGLPADPGHAVAARQMRGGFGGLLSLQLRGGPPAAGRAAAALTLFHRATSFGSCSSLAEWRANGPAPELLRLSVGLEDPAELLADLQQALAAA
ncbi:trans-sulfuration enzyme family protein [Roseomonas sp. BN140053]|uniref:trans-sulfuration enzyme family protein n=1 Tax=Roseomonas sp. BN140053 TaxID=3391898 RepID=UPI0039EAEEB8